MSQMQPWTREELHRFAPPPKSRGDGDDRPAIHASYVATLLDSWQLMQDAGINSPIRLAMFMSVVGHETGGCTIGDEYCTWSADRMCQLWPQRFAKTDPLFLARYTAARKDEEKLAELAYGGWNDLGQRLGNKEPGDGWRYRGRGMKQITGRDAYREAGDAIGIDLEADPDQLDDPRVSLKVTLWQWQSYGLGVLADRGYVRAVHNKVNRGNAHSKFDPNNWADRQRQFDKAWSIWNRGTSLPDTTELAVGAFGPPVAALQTRLRELGYPCGKVDSIFGDECRRALAAFKADWKAAGGHEIDPDDIVGDATQAALAIAKPIRRPERENMSIGDLIASGSTEAAAGRNMQRLATPVGLVSALGSANFAVDSTPTVAPQSVDPTPALQQAVGWVPAAKGIMVPVIESGMWAAKHWWWVAGIALAVWLYAGGWLVIKARLKAARQGLNLWR